MSLRAHNLAARKNVCLFLKSSDQDDHQSQESDRETRFPNPPGCAWFDKLNLDPMIQSDTAKPIADVRKGSFTRDKLNRLIRLFDLVDEKKNSS